MIHKGITIPVVAFACTLAISALAADPPGPAFALDSVTLDSTKLRVHFIDIGPGLAVHVVGISEDQVLETERIQSQTVYEADPTLAWGETLTMEGRDGVYYRQYLLVYEDGDLISRELEQEWYDPEPIDTTI